MRQASLVPPASLRWPLAGLSAAPFHIRISALHHVLPIAMTAAQFRRLALRLPEAVEAEHMGHPDFRVGGKIFATLGPDEDWGMVKLTPPEQAALIASEPDVFHPASGAWGRSGSTIVQLRQAKAATVEQALLAAWCNTAPKRLVKEFREE
jgi:hypothetical protein